MVAFDVLQGGIFTLFGLLAFCETIRRPSLGKFYMDSSGSVDSVPKAFGRYRVEKVLGEGAMGVVYLARDSQLDRQVALKIPKFGGNDDPELLERFYREARSAATLRHPNICTVYEVGKVDGVHYLTMAYIKGHMLSNYVNPKTSPSERQVVGIVRKLASALNHAHKRGVVHRDLKPSNIMVDGRNDPIVMDFGLARQLEFASNRLTQTGTILGTPAYMSPEQVRAEWDNVGPRSDIYSLGVILYELLTGKLPFDGPVGVVMAMVLTQEPENPSVFRPDLDRRLEAICLKMMSKRIEERYGTMDEVASALTAFAAAALDNSRRRDADDSVGQRQTLVGRQTPTSTSQTVQSLRGSVQATSFKLSNGLACLPVWVKGLIGTVAVMLLIFSISLPFRADTEMAESDTANDFSMILRPKRKPDQNRTVPPANPLPRHPVARPQATAKPPSFLKSSIGIQLVYIPVGEFQMGSPDSDTDAAFDEKRQHLVRITRPFFLSEYEVTQQQYQKVMGNRPWHGKEYVQDGPSYPATYVSWSDAVDFCRKLGNQEGVDYRLPTEAEWEYACRAGTTTGYSFVDDMSKLGQYAWFRDNAWGIGEKYPHRVGQKLPNPWGLHDMHGNVWEWCSDRYARYGNALTLTDPTGPARGERRVLRGGSFHRIAMYARSASRAIGAPDERSFFNGFRLARTYKLSP